MVRRAFLLTAVFVAVFVSGADRPPYAKALDKVAAVKSVVIDANGAWTDRISGHETPEMCKTFTLKAVDVREFFRKARRVSLREYSHDLPAAMCYAAGEVTFGNGDTAKWHIDQARRGFLALTAGRTVYFYCSKCAAKVFAKL